MASGASLAGKVALVTGAGGGLGRSHALALARAGAAVVVNDLGSAIDGSGSDSGRAAAVAAEISALGGRAAADTHDIADWDQATALVDAALSAFGRVDIVVNNAGISRYDTIETETRAGWERVMSVNLTGTTAVMRQAAAHWRDAGPALGRAIVNTSSPAGTNPVPGAASYVASKAAVAALTIAAATELAEFGVRVNAIAPIARTRMTKDVPVLRDIMAPRAGFDRVAPEHVSQLMLYLASAECRFTGRIFGVEGDDIFLFSGFSAEGHVSNGGEAWNVEGLAAALDELDAQDRGYFIAPSTHVRGASPSDAVLDAFDAIARGARVKTWSSIHDD
jgi:NAD(P)-dependent dehydrogenase (short-subunit alcohol dehydrogenase family)